MQIVEVDTSLAIYAVRDDTGAYWCGRDDWDPRPCEARLYVNIGIAKGQATRLNREREERFHLVEFRCVEVAVLAQAEGGTDKV